MWWAICTCISSCIQPGQTIGPIQCPRPELRLLHSSTEVWLDLLKQFIAFVLQQLWVRQVAIVQQRPLVLRSTSNRTCFIGSTCPTHSANVTIALVLTAPTDRVPLAYAYTTSISPLYAHVQTRVTCAYTCACVNTHGRRLLIETGAMSEKWHTVGKKDRKGKKEPGQHGDHSKSSSRCKPVKSLLDGRLIICTLTLQCMSLCNA